MTTVTNPVTPDDIGTDFVAQLIEDVVQREMDGEIVVVGRTQVIVLNPTAALVWQFLDGEATLGELIAELSDALEVDPKIVEADVLVFARQLAAAGLLANVELPEPELFSWDAWEPPAPVDVGDELDDFTLPDLDGTSRSLSDFRGRRVLLVNWSPGCGFCVRIVEELAALHPRLAVHEVELVFVTVGDAAANHAVFDDAQLQAPALLRDGTEIDSFGGVGTPAAYLLDEEGRLAEPMVVGADQVPVLARDLAGVDPTTEFIGDAAGDPHAVDDGPRARYLPAPAAMCGPGGGGGASNSTEWAGTRAYAFGEFHVGLRYDAEATADALDRLFPGARVDDRRVPDNYSIALGGSPATRGAGSSRSLKLLVQGGTQLVRSRSGGRVLAGLLAYLSADLTEPDPALVRLDATAAVRGEDGLLLPPGPVNWVNQLQPRFGRVGIALVDSPHAVLDLATNELVVSAPAIPHDPVVLDELDRGVRTGAELPWVRPGRYPLTAWFLPHAEVPAKPLTRGVAVTTALPQLFDLQDLATAVDQLADLFERIEARGVWYTSAAELVAQVKSVLG